MESFGGGKESCSFADIAGITVHIHDFDVHMHELKQSSAPSLSWCHCCPQGLQVILPPWLMYLSTTKPWQTRAQSFQCEKIL